MPLQCRRCFCHLHQGNDPLLHSGATGAAKQDDRQTFLCRAFHSAGNFLPHHMPHAAHQKSCVTNTEHCILAVYFTVPNGDRLMQSGLFLCRFYFVLISRELQRIRLRQILKPRGKRSGIRHHADAVSGAPPEITATFIADIQIFFRFLFIDLPAAGRAHNRLLQRLYCLHRCFFCRFFFPLLKQSRHFSSTPPCCRLQT